MTSTNLQLNWLRTFEVAGRLLSFSNAAVELNMSQSAVSQQIKLLEHKLGKSLFLRQTRAIQLTVAGRAYLGVVQKGLKHIEQGMDSIFSSVAQGVLELSVNNTFAQLWLTPRLGRFATLYPQVSIRMYGVNWETDAPPSNAELEIRYGTGTWAGMESLKLLPQGLRPYGSLAMASQLREAGGLLSLPLIDVLGTPNGWSDWLAQHPQGYPEQLQRFYVDSYAIAANMAVENVGVCLLNDELVQGSRLREFLAPLLDQRIDCQASYYLVKHHDSPLSGAAKAFHGWLISELKSPAHERI
ncbi:LysR family transcriptional regulator [Pseudomonas aeruginosa]|jgi:LysR family glycine cleavage system transcriptional activator|uniref:LysR family transcriptional regulator n=1 Tax=Pseudomonas aeruginosa TaxID=287 RepID=UPI002966D060|nr:LysR family transcriptional regulator [Pseudomonas aeruginosa]MDW2963194.1 LysR family transcriptional regulator [Pseudomonas aeruginosa]HEP8117524.1 LysR family transcriptional regulator [Pseudomonas aeruginosa]